ncbi:bifunctional 5-dehydro-2-deoxygluconokinase/5-dehydro-2-deoxyphosphogluconate aldolase [Pseudovibrio japonicus]|uniref:bifunctional 5-dehydro-2-deoxygluconokinase/5-dehydro-2- deoxyphosphogluconate aldolase n=1 Tax=Pseudovibrio japonicus TaxID=366534 RepID=UPI001678413C|nr:5-dehydro-2-deoxygluconokinase [Pseudovibrio japonicus]
MFLRDWETPLKPLDVITIGRSSVDLYGTQVGSRLEDMSSFKKYVGGSPTNMSVGTARLGLKSALISRVGDEHMGRFIREQLVKEGVCVDGLVTDKERLTALVLLGIRDKEQFPLIFYREDCADMALCEDDIDPEFIARAGCVTVTGTHLSHPRTEAAVLKALRLARENGARTALDIDYRPNLWGLAGHGAGEERFIASEKVTAELQKHLHLFDLIVGTEEEFHIAGGTTDTLAALNAVRKVSKAALVCKRGPMGAVVFENEIGASLDEGKSGPGFPIEVFNVLGAGDGFMSGLLRGWLKDESWETTLTYANACGAFAVSRHGCAPAYPSWEELQWFLKNGSTEHALRKDKKLEQIHWATNRKGDWSEMKVFAFDHRSQLEDMAAKVGAPEDKIPEFKELCLKAAQQVRAGRDHYGILCDGRLGEEALFRATGTGLWIGRPVEVPGSRPLDLEIGPDLGTQLAEWPVEHVVKVLCFYHPDDNDHMKAVQEETVIRLAHASRENNLEMLLEVIPSKVGPVNDDTTAAIIKRFYELGVYPDWWKLEPLKTDAGWQNACDAIKANDPWCRGIVVLGLDAPASELSASFEVAGKHDLVKGFAVGRTIFAEAAEKWLAGRISDEEAIANMAAKFEGLGSVWEQARASKKEVA